MTALDTASAFAAYEAVRHRLPQVTDPGGAPRKAGCLDDIAEGFDAFLLDAFGVLNIGETAIAGVAERIAGLRAQGKQVLVVSNAAGQPHNALVEKYTRLGYDFTAEDVITSRATMMAAMTEPREFHWGMMADASQGQGGLENLSFSYLGDTPEPYGEASGFLMVGAGDWSDRRQSLLEAALRDRPRPVLVANPDIVAPRETGFSTEPGYFAHQLADRTGIAPQFYGKPFGNIFERAMDRLGHAIPKERVLMVGDSLHTDVLGARTAGVKSALIADFGFFAGHDVDAAIGQAGFAPDFVLNRP